MEEVFDPAPVGYVRCGCCEDAKPKSEFSKSQLAKIKKKQKLANCLECVSDAAEGLVDFVAKIKIC
jgi:hypothetical protein